MSKSTRCRQLAVGKRKVRCPQDHQCASVTMSAWLASRPPKLQDSTWAAFKGCGALPWSSSVSVCRGCGQCLLDAGRQSRAV